MTRRTRPRPWPRAREGELERTRTRVDFVGNGMTARGIGNRSKGRMMIPRMMEGERPKIPLWMDPKRKRKKLVRCWKERGMISVDARTVAEGTVHWVLVSVSMLYMGST